MLGTQLVSAYNMIPGERFSYSSETKTIQYIPESIETPLGRLALLHEIAHARLGHFSYIYDVELFTMELEAWEETKRLALEYSVEADIEHIENCIESYDKWLTRRATCPKCSTYGHQRNYDLFSCFICDTYWKVNHRKDREIRRMVIKNQ